MIPGMNQPAKLKLTGYKDRELRHFVGSLFAMYNPASVSLSYQTDFASDAFINSTRNSNRYVQTRPGGLTLELLFDAKMPGNDAPIDSQLELLRYLCYDVDAARSEPRYLKVTWGQMRWNGYGYFAGRLGSLEVKYTLFERDAKPLRATATLNLLEDQSLTLQRAKEGKESPEKTVVQAPDMTSLPAITKKAGGSMKSLPDYLSNAAENDLDSLDGFAAGDKLQISGKGGN
jgi:hypothetical protein